MPGLNASLSIGLSALQASQAALNVVGHNIANVNTPNYSRQRAILANNDSQTFGTLQYGQGVNLNNIIGVRDRFLEMQITQATSRKSGADTRYTMLEAISPTFLESGSDSDLSALVTKFFQGFQDLTSRPEDGAVRTAVVGRAQSLVNGIQSRWQLLQDQRAQADGSVRSLVSEVNTITTEIAKLNARIGAEPSPGADSDSRDQRQTLANKLADIVGVQVYEDSNSQMQITLDSGAAVLVSGTAAYTLSTTPDIALGNFNRVDITLGAGTTIDITKSVKDGALGANLDLRDNVLSGYQQKLDQLASGIGGQVNLLHRAGFALNGTTGLNFFSGLAAVGGTGLPTTVVGAANSMRVDATIAADPRLIAAADAAGAVGNNKNAVALANLQLATNTVDTNNDGIGDSGPFGTMVSTLTSSIGTTVQGLKSRSTGDENLMVALQNQHDRISGVDLDEEATQMMAFQRGYQASSRFISVINQLTDQLVNQFGR
ncbi:MAG: flagellar hook-associated protein FlgK [Holophaga sp.]|nr:flagellar hook-associated protein FlgK [Holophaga sp.]